MKIPRVLMSLSPYSHESKSPNSHESMSTRESILPKLNMIGSMDLNAPGFLMSSQVHDHESVSPQLPKVLKSLKYMSLRVHLFMSPRCKSTKK